MSCRRPLMRLTPGCQRQGACREISLTKPTPMPRRSFRSVCTERMGVWRGRSKRRWLESSRVPTGCVRSASSPFLRLVWKQCLGRTFAVRARNSSAPSPDGGDRTNNPAFCVLGVPLKHERGLSASSAITFRNTYAAGCAGNVENQLLGRVLIPSTRIARSVALIDRQEQRLLGV